MSNYHSPTQSATYNQKLRFIIFSLLFIGTANAKIYEYMDAKNNVIYADHPPLYFKAKQLTTTPQTISRPTTDSLIPVNSVNTATITAQKIQIESPINQQTIWNAHNTAVIVSISPIPVTQYSVQILLDGIPQQPAAPKTHFELQNLSKGSHYLQAQLLGPKKELINSSPQVTIFIHDTSIQTQTGYSINQNQP